MKQVKNYALSILTRKFSMMLPEGFEILGLTHSSPDDLITVLEDPERSQRWADFVMVNEREEVPYGARFIGRSSHNFFVFIVP